MKNAEKAIQKLDGDLTSVQFDPFEPASIQAAITYMETEVDSRVSLYKSNPLVKDLVSAVKENLANQIQESAKEKRKSKLATKVDMMNDDIFQRIENCVNDLKWAEYSTFDKHIRKLSKVLNSESVAEISNSLKQAVDLKQWLEQGHGAHHGMVGSAQLNWPEDEEKEFGLTLALIDKFAMEKGSALHFSHTFYNKGTKYTANLQNMVGQLLSPFSRDFSIFLKQKLGVSNKSVSKPSFDSANRKIFLVHGHCEATKQTIARYLERLNFDVIILHERASQSRTIIEKIEAFDDVGYAVVLLTPDDVGSTLGTPNKPRARQNVITELGYFIGKLGRERVTALKKGDVEVPSDFSGVIYIPIDEGDSWKIALNKELDAAGYNIDWNVMKS